MSTTVDVLIAAREIYAKSPSHAKLGDYPRFGSNCMITAVQVASRDHNVYSGSEHRSAMNFLQDAVPTRDRTSPRMNLIYYNEKHLTELCLTVFDRAIDNAKKSL